MFEPMKVTLPCNEIGNPTRVLESAMGVEIGGEPYCATDYGDFVEVIGGVQLADAYVEIVVHATTA